MIRGLVLALALAAPAMADTIGEEKRFVVNAVGKDDFEVIRLRHMAAAELWCAAASHVIRRQGLPGTTAIYLRGPLGASRTEPGRAAVLFSLSNAGLPAPGVRLTLTVDAPGETMKAAAALRYCRDAFTRSTK